MAAAALWRLTLSTRCVTRTNALTSGENTGQTEGQTDRRTDGGTPTIDAASKSLLGLGNSLIFDFHAVFRPYRNSSHFSSECVLQ